MGRRVRGRRGNEYATYSSTLSGASPDRGGGKIWPVLRRPTADRAREFEPVFEGFSRG